MKVLETERLIVRRLEADDLDSFSELCGSPDVMKYVGDGLPLSREQVREWIEKSQENYAAHGFGCFAVVLKEGGRFIGYCGLINPVGGAEAEIIYALEKSYWGRGLAGETAGAMLDYGLGRCSLRRIVATIDPENRASVRIVEKLGMKYRLTRLDEHGLPEMVYLTERVESEPLA